MTKTIKKSLVVLSVLAMFLMSVLFLSACGDDSDPDNTDNNQANFVIAQNVKTNANAIIDSLVADIYNNSTDLGTQTTYSLDEIREVFPTFNYYVEVGEIQNVSQVNSISFNELTLNANQTFYLSIGNSNQLLEEAFYVQDSKLYVAAPIIVFEAVDNSKIKINDNEYDFDLDVTANSINFTNVRFNEGCASTADKISDTEYTLNIRSGKEFAGLYYSNAQADDVILTKRILNGELNGYGLVQPYNGTDGYCSYFYPVGWEEDFSQVNVDKFDGAVFDYSVYITNLDSVANVKLNIDIITE